MAHAQGVWGLIPHLNPVTYRVNIKSAFIKVIRKLYAIGLWGSCLQVSVLICDVTWETVGNMLTVNLCGLNEA